MSANMELILLAKHFVLPEVNQIQGKFLKTCFFYLITSHIIHSAHVRLLGSGPRGLKPKSNFFFFFHIASLTDDQIIKLLLQDMMMKRLRN